MSINFHAYQCRNYLLSDYEEIEKQWHSEFTDYNPDRVMKILNLERDDMYLYIRYFQTLYRMNLKNGVLEKQTEPDTSSELMKQPKQKKQFVSGAFSGTSCLPDQHAGKLYMMEPESELPGENGWTGRVYFNESMVIYHLLHYVKDHPENSGVWIPNSRLDTRAARNDQREDLLFTSFCTQFSGKTDLLELACKKLNGTPVQTKADLSYQFHAFPQVPLQLLFWDADEDFPAQVQILVDQHITDYVHLETTGCMVSDLFERLNEVLS